MTPTLPPNAANSLKRRRLRVEGTEITGRRHEDYGSVFSFKNSFVELNSCPFLLIIFLSLLNPHSFLFFNLFTVVDVDSLCRGLPGKGHAVDSVPALAPIVHSPISVFYLDDACGFGAGVLAYQAIDHIELDLILWYRLSGVIELILVAFDSAGDGETIEASLLCIDRLSDSLAIVGGG